MGGKLSNLAPPHWVLVLFGLRMPGSRPPPARWHLRCKGNRGEVGPFPWMSGTDHLHSMRTTCIYKSSRIGNHNLLIENWIQYQFHHHWLQIAGNIAALSVERLCAIVGKVMELWGGWETTRMTIEYHIGRVAKIWVGSILENHSKHSFHDHRSWMRMMHCTDKQKWSSMNQMKFT